MTLEDTINGVESLIKQREVAVPEPLRAALKTSTMYGRFAYFDGRKVTADDLAVYVKGILHAEPYYQVRVEYDGREDYYVIETKDLSKFVDSIADVQDIAER